MLSGRTIQLLFGLAAGVMLSGAPVAVALDGEVPYEQLQELLTAEAEDIRGTLPGYAKHLAVGSLALRGVLESVTEVPSGKPEWLRGKETISVLRFRVSEVFYWDEKTVGLARAHTDTIVSFNTNTYTFRIGGHPSPEAGREYWVMTFGPRRTPSGEFALSGFLPIEDEAILFTYDALSQAEDGTTQRSASSLRLPLDRYRECIYPTRRQASKRILPVLWECR